MNWTGGRLSRHSGPAISATNRQKQYFSRVKQSLENDRQRESPARWTILNRVVEERTGNHWTIRAAALKSAGDDPERGSLSQQPHLQSTEKPPSTPRDPVKHINQLAKPQYDHHSEVHIKRERFHEKGRYSQTRTNEDPFDGGNRNSQVYIKTDYGQKQDNNYERRGQSQERKRKREASEHCLDECSQEKITTVERRRKLLKKEDWVGSAALIPPKVAFKSPTREENVGRRRKIADHDRPRFESRPINWTSPFARQPALDLVPGSRASFRRLPGMNEVRITIGGQEIPLGVSSSVIPIRVTGNSSRAPSRVNRVSPSSGIMLLDKNGSSLKAFRVHEKERARAETVFPSSPLLNASQSWRQLAGERQFGRGEDLVKSCALVSLPMEKYSAYGSDRPLSEPIVGYGQFSLCSKRSGAAPSPMSVMKSQAVNGQMAYSSSSAPIQHPKPQSSKVFLYLRSTSTDIAESNAARVGYHHPIISNSELLNNEIWRTWVAPLEHEKDSDDEFDELRNGDERICISPSVSALLAIQQDRGASFDGSNHSNLDSPATIGSGISSMERFEGTFYKATGSETDEIKPHLGYYGDRASEKVQISTRCSPVTILKLDVELGRKAVPEQTKEDPNEIWRRFVFGNDGARNDTTLDECLKWTTSPTNGGEELSAASMVAQHSVGEQWSSSISVTNEGENEESTEQTTVDSISSGSNDTRDGEPFVRYKKPKYVALQTHYHPSEDDGYSLEAVPGTMASVSSDAPRPPNCVVDSPFSIYRNDSGSGCLTGR